MEWMDEVAGITAKRFAGCEVATVAVEQIRFLKPVPVGAFVDVAGEVVKVGNTSLQIKISVVMDSQEEAEGVLAQAVSDRAIAAVKISVRPFLDFFISYSPFLS